MSSRGPIGLYGGTFDPVHLGHLLLAEAARDALGLAQIQFVIAHDPPHKVGRTVTPAAQRLAMLELAVADNPGFAICTWEMEQAGPSYTVNTLRHFHELGYGPIYLLVGGDSIAALDTWHRPDEVRRLANLVVVDRPGSVIPAGIQVLELPLLAIASTGIRERVRQGRTIRYWVPEAVRAYIEAQGLFRSTPGL